MTQVGFIHVLHVVWALFDLSNESTKAIVFNDVSVWSLVVSVPLWAICQFVTAGLVVVKLPYIDLLPQTQLREVASCTLLAEVLPKFKGSPEGFI